MESRLAKKIESRVETVMTIFQLLLYSCVSTHYTDGNPLTKTCDWRPDAFFAQEDQCKQNGTNELGHLVFSEAAEERRIEYFKCAETDVVGKP